MNTQLIATSECSTHGEYEPCLFDRVLDFCGGWVVVGFVCVVVGVCAWRALA